MKTDSRLPTVTPLRPPARLAPALVRALPGWEVRLTVYVTGGECRYRAHALTTRYLPGCVLALDVPGAPSDGERPAWVALVDALAACEHLDVNEHAQVTALRDVLRPARRTP